MVCNDSFDIEYAVKNISVSGPLMCVLYVVGTFSGKLMGKINTAKVGNFSSS